MQGAQIRPHEGALPFGLRVQTVSDQLPPWDPTCRLLRLAIAFCGFKAVHPRPLCHPTPMDWVGVRSWRAAEWDALAHERAVCFALRPGFSWVTSQCLSDVFQLVPRTGGVPGELRQLRVPRRDAFG